MQDILMMILAAAFFGLSFAFVVLCQRLMEQAK
jgi:hypothetical protein